MGAAVGVIVLVASDISQPELSQLKVRSLVTVRHQLCCLRGIVCGVIVGHLSDSCMFRDCECLDVCCEIPRERLE